MPVTLRPYQHESLAAIDREIARVRSTLIVLPTGCHRAGQTILMHDGSIKRVEDVVVGDRLMGPDGTPRAVLQLARGEDEMVEIRPTKGASWVVNLDHVLTLVRTSSGDTYPSERGGVLVDVTVREWLRWSRTAKHTHKLLRASVDFPESTPPRIDPYVLGVLLGDGCLTSGITVTAADREIWSACEPEARRWGLRFVPLTPKNRCHGFKLSGEQGPGTNALLDEIGRLGLRVTSGDKFIPDAYKLGDRGVRREVLAGLLDTDGHLSVGGYDLVSKSRQLADDVAFVARSLGLAAYVSEKRIRYAYKGRSDVRQFWRVNISGECSQISCRVFRKRAAPRRQKKDVQRTGFAVVPTGTRENYFGFALDGDQRYLLGDFTVTHNTGKTTVFSVAAQRWVQARSERVLVLADREELLDQARKRLDMFGVDARIEQGSRSAGAARVVVASVATMVRRLDRWAPDAFGLIIEDECQHSPAASRTKIREHFWSAKVLGVTATPKRADEKSLDDVYESLAYQMDIRAAIRAGYLVPVSARRVVVDAIKLAELKANGGDFVQRDLAAVMEAERAVSGVVVPLLELSTDRPTIVFAASVVHAQMLAEAIGERRPGAAVVVHGELKGDERKHRLGAYESGRCQYLVNVDIATEGYDHPPTSCIAMARPTKSWARYVQAAGRGLRPSLETGKRDCLILDFTGTAGRHALCGPADVLGAPGELADDVRAEIERLLGTAQLEVSTVIAAAEGNVSEQRQKHAAAAVIQWHAEKINPFIGRTSHVALPADRPHGWGGAPASEAALAEIERLTTNHKGEVVLSRDKLPPSFSRADAWRLITVLKHRDRNGLCTYAQAKRLSGFIDTVTLSRRDAGRLMAAGAKLGWPDGVRAEIAAIRAEQAAESTRAQEQVA